MHITNWAQRKLMVFELFVILASVGTAVCRVAFTVFTLPLLGPVLEVGKPVLVDLSFVHLFY